MSSNTARRGGKDGFVLVAVLSVLALMSGLVLSMMLLSRDVVESASLATMDLDTDALAQSAVAVAGYELFILKLPSKQVDGQNIRLTQGAVSISVSTDASKVDLNGAGKELLIAAYTASGLQTMTPESFAARVMDWRDRDDDARPEGSEAADYAEKGLGFGPRNGPFRSIDDLRWVDGMASTDISVLSDFVTVYNPKGRIDVYSASAALIAALPGVTQATADQILSTRKSRSEMSVAKLNDLLLVQSAMITTETPKSFRLLLRVRPNHNGRDKRIEVVVTRGITSTAPFHTLSWSEW